MKTRHIPSIDGSPHLAEYCRKGWFGGGEETALVVAIMTDQPITLDGRRGMAAQKATEIRRLLAEVEANEQSLRSRQEELEMQLIAVPATTWFEAAQKARYLLGLFAATAVAQDPAERC